MTRALPSLCLSLPLSPSPSLSLTRAPPSPLAPPQTKLFVGGLPNDCAEPELRNLMMPFGQIVDIHLMAPSQRTQQRCAFVTFGDHASAVAATALGNKNQAAHVHAQVDPRFRSLVVRFADSQGQVKRVPGRGAMAAQYGAAPMGMPGM